MKMHSTKNYQKPMVGHRWKDLQLISDKCKDDSKSIIREDKAPHTHKILVAKPLTTKKHIRGWNEDRLRKFIIQKLLISNGIP